MNNEIITTNITISDMNRSNINVLKDVLNRPDYKTGYLMCAAYPCLMQDIFLFGEYRRHPLHNNIIVDVSTGDVYREKHKGIAEKIQISPRTDGYYRISIDKKLYYVHRIVVEAFLGELLEDSTNGLADSKSAKMDIHHCEFGDCNVNSIYNLRVLTHSQNCKFKNIVRNEMNIEEYQIIKDEEIIASVRYQRDVAELIGGTQSAVSKAYRGILGTFHGYRIVPVYERQCEK